MNKAGLLSGVCFLSLAGFVRGGDATTEPKELSDLQSKYESDVQDAIKPIKDRYLDDLKALLQTELDKGDADAVVIVKKEIKKMEAESPYSGRWTSHSDGVSIIQFKSDGRWVEDWNGNTHLDGHWEMDKNNGQLVVTRSDGYVYHYQINSEGHLIRDVGSTDYTSTEGP
jgi:hypothetical protein